MLGQEVEGCLNLIPRINVILSGLSEKNHFAPLAQITAEIQDITKKSLSLSTIQRALHMEGYAGRVGLRKPFVNNKNRLVHLKWSRERLTWDDEWNQIIW